MSADSHDGRICDWDWDDVNNYLSGGNVVQNADEIDAKRNGVVCTTGNPVAYFDGSIIYTQDDIPYANGITWFGHKRSYRNQSTGTYEGPNGSNWAVLQTPYITTRIDGGQSYYVVSLGPNRTFWFKDDGSPRFNEQHGSLEHDTTNNVFVLTLDSGLNAPGSRSSVTQYVFYDFEAIVGERGIFKSYTDPGGNTIEAVGYADGQITGIKLTRANGGVEKLDYTYFTSGSYDRRLQYVTYSRRTSAGPPEVYSDISRAEYEYYDGSTDDGMLNDLKAVTLELWNGSAWVGNKKTHYRYWKDGQTDFATYGFAHGLKYVLGPAAYQRMVDDGYSDPTAATEAQIADYADNYFEYDSATKRVTLEIAGGGCGGCGLGNGTTGDTFAYADNADGSYTDAYNNWKRKTTVTHPITLDGNGDERQLIETIYMNYAGQILLHKYTETIDPTGSPATHSWAEFFQYDDKGRLVFAASPKAVDTSVIDEADLDLLNQRDGNDVGDTVADLEYEGVYDDEGKITLTYYDDTRGGQVKEQWVREGDNLANGGGTPVLTQAYEYEDLSGVNEIYSGAPDLYPIKKVKAYPTAGGSSVDTQLEYLEWYGSGTQVKHLRTTLPTISSGQNGSGSAATIETIFDQDGNVIWRKDERGIIDYYEYYPDLNTVKKHIADIDITNSSISGKPSWSTASGAGQEVTTEFTYDDLGRPTEVLGAYRNAAIGGPPLTVTSVRSADWFVYDDNDEETDDVVLSASGYVNGSDTIVGPIAVVYRDKAGQVTQAITSKRDSSETGSFESGETIPSSSDWQSRVVTERDKKNRVSKIKRYYDITGGLSSDTQYAYDSVGRQSRIVSPDGTIQRTIYDGYGRPIESWTGTDDGDTSGDWDVTQNVNMVIVGENTYDDNGNLLTVTVHVDGSHTRLSTLSYDYRNRLETTDGEEDFFLKYSYDNLDRVTQTERYNTAETGTAPIGNLVALEQTKYDDRGRVYQAIVQKVDPSAIDDGYGTDIFLTSNTWYDAAGNVIKSQPGGTARFTKYHYDSLGRVTDTYVGYDEDESTYTEAADTSTSSGDTIIEHATSTYDKAGSVLTVKTLSRNHDHTSDAALTTSNARPTYQASFYDGIGRQIASADYGTDPDNVIASGAGVVAYPTSIPTRSDTILVNETGYDVAGRVEKLLSPRIHSGTDPIETRYEYDDAGRVIKTIDNYRDGTPGSGADDRVTEFVYTDDDQIKTATAKVAGSSDQITRYVYGTAQGGITPEVYRNNLLRAVIYPDSINTPLNATDTTALGNGTGSYDRVEMKYNRLGELIERKDQRQTTHAYEYDGLGRLDMDSITALGGVGGTVQRVDRSYEVRGMLEGVTSYDDPDEGEGNVINEVFMEYNDFGQLANDYQDHDSEVSTSGTVSPLVAYTYETGSDGTKGIRQTKLTYPNGRDVHYLYNDTGDTPGLSHYLSRVTALSIDSSRDDTGTDDNVIAAYDYMGMGTVVRKSYPTPAIRLDYIDESGEGDLSGDPYDASIDRFGRIVRQQWEDYASGTGTGDIFHVKHAYDRSGNRLYADRQVYTSDSQYYQYDTLDRLEEFKSGLSDMDGGSPPAPQSIEAYWTFDKRGFGLDQMGNQLSIDTPEATGYITHEVASGQANEYTSRSTKAEVAKAAFEDDFSNSSTEGNWTRPSGSGNGRSIASDVLTVSAVTNSGDPDGVFLWSPLIGPLTGEVQIEFPSGSASGDLAGFVFGYKSNDDYWLLVREYGTDVVTLYHYTTAGGLSFIASYNESSVVTTSPFILDLTGRRNSMELMDYNFPNGFPGGRVGIYTNKSGVKFDDFTIHDRARPVDVHGRWLAFGAEYIAGSPDALQLIDDTSNRYTPVLINGVRAEKFEAVFSIRRASSTPDAVVKFIFNATDLDDYDLITLPCASNTTAPLGYKVEDGHYETLIASDTSGVSNPPTVSAGSDIWYRVTSDGTDITVRSNTSGTNLDSAPICYQTSSSAGDRFDFFGGLFGFAASQGDPSITSFTLKTDRDTNPDYEKTEIVEDFNYDGGTDYAEDSPVYDAAGNLTYDGVYSYTYDAWNRLVEVAKAYRDPTGTGTVTTGPTIAKMRYDGLGRRVSKQVINDGVLSAGNNGKTYHYYYDGQSVIQMDNQDDEMLKQYVWGIQYIDELCQIGRNQDPANAHSAFNGPTYYENECEYYYYPLQDANYNTLGVVDATGRLIERYEYTPYGQRTVYSHGILNGDLDGDGYVGLDDLQLILDNWNQNVSGPQPYDQNGDGYVGLDDMQVLLDHWNEGVPLNDPLVTTSTYASTRLPENNIAGEGPALCEIGFQGLFHDEEFGAQGGLIHVRGRTLHPRFARFMQRDPAGYTDSYNLYEGLICNPCNRFDPMGLESSQMGVSDLPIKDDGDGPYIDLEGLTNEEFDKLAPAMAKWLVDQHLKNLKDRLKALETECASSIANIRQSTGPDITDWFIRTTVANGEMGRSSLHLARFGNTMTFEDVYNTYNTWKNLVKANAPWDFKPAIIAMNINAGYVGMADVTMYNRSVRFDVPANVHYGYVGRQSGFGETELLLGAGIAQNGYTWSDIGALRQFDYGDDPYDQNAIRVGFRAYDLVREGYPPSIALQSAFQTAYDLGQLPGNPVLKTNDVSGIPDSPSIRIRPNGNIDYGDMK